MFFPGTSVGSKQQFGQVLAGYHMDIPDRPTKEVLLPMVRCKGGVPLCGVTTQPTREFGRFSGVFGYFPLYQHRGCLGPVLDYETLLGNTVSAFHDFF